MHTKCVLLAVFTLDGLSTRARAVAHFQTNAVVAVFVVVVRYVSSWLSWSRRRRRRRQLAASFETTHTQTRRFSGECLWLSVQQIHRYLVA